MIRWRGGNKIFRSQCLSYGISYSLDSEISPPCPKSWSTRIFTKAFSESDGELAGLRDCRVQHAERSYSHGNDNPSQICCV